MGDGLSATGPGSPAGAACGNPETVIPDHEPVTRQRLGDAPVEPPAAAPGDLVRYGPGVPAGLTAASAGLTAEHIWRGGGTPGPRRRRTRLGKILGWALTAVLLTASGVLLYQRFHHVPLQDTGVAILGSGSPACRVTVTGQITTNGGQGTLTYQWLFPTGPPSTLHQSLSAGQSTVDVQATVIGSGHGTAPQRVWLRVLQPVRQMASEYIVIRCP